MCKIEGKTKYPAGENHLSTTNDDPCFDQQIYLMETSYTCDLPAHSSLREIGNAIGVQRCKRTGQCNRLTSLHLLAFCPHGGPRPSVLRGCAHQYFLYSLTVVFVPVHVRNTHLNTHLQRVLGAYLRLENAIFWIPLNIIIAFTTTSLA